MIPLLLKFIEWIQNRQKPMGERMQHQLNHVTGLMQDAVARAVAKGAKPEIDTAMPKTKAAILKLPTDKE